MARGKYWEMLYDPNGRNPTQEAFLPKLGNTTGYENSRILSSPEPLAERNYKEKHFRCCDFNIHIASGSFTNCSFEQCRFVGCSFKSIKFSNCVFKNCHFFIIRLEECTFVNGCSFTENSASWEQFEIIATELSPKDFLTNLSTNLAYLPDNVAADYQLHRLVTTKANIAKILYKSTEAAGNMEFYFQAQKEYIIYGLLSKIEGSRYKRESATSKPVKRSKSAFFIRTCFLQAEMHVTLLSGWLTDWGRSLSRAFWFVVCLLAIFSLIYSNLGLNYDQAALKALEVTSVAGYTIHRSPDKYGCQEWITLCNLILGLYWYSLAVPLLCRRVLR